MEKALRVSRPFYSLGVTNLLSEWRLLTVCPGKTMAKAVSNDRVIIGSDDYSFIGALET